MGAAANPQWASIAALSGITINTTPITGGTNGNCLYDNAGVIGNQACGGTGGQLLNVRVFTSGSSTTYTPTAGTNSIIIFLQGAGGGGAGLAAPGASHVNVGGGGQSGAFCQKRLTANFSGGTYTVGTKGTGGASGGDHTGNTGNNTTFTDTASTVYTAGGGGGGFASGAQTAPTIGGSFATPPSCTNADFQSSGIDGGIAIDLTSTTLGWSGAGAPSRFGGGGHGNNFFSANVAAAGVSCANAPGAGGGGGHSNGTGGTVAGGDGCDGIIIIYEYS